MIVCTSGLRFCVLPLAETKEAFGLDCGAAPLLGWNRQGSGTTMIESTGTKVGFGTGRVIAGSNWSWSRMWAQRSGKKGSSNGLPNRHDRSFPLGLPGPIPRITVHRIGQDTNSTEWKPD